MKSTVIRTVSGVTRKLPWVTDLLRKAMPLALKRKLGAALLSKEESIVSSSDGRQFVSIPDRVFLQVVYDGIFEPSLTNFIKSRLRDGDWCVDVGANFGWFTTLMAQQAEKVIAYEPGKRIAGILRENVRLNKCGERVEVRELAVGRVSGTGSLLIEGDSAEESALAFVSTENNPGAESLPVQIVALDEDLEEYIGKIALMKLDAEGYEYECLLGGSRFFCGRDAPVLIVEANQETLSRAGSSREMLCEELKRLGYTLFGMNKDGSIFPDNGEAPALACLPSGRNND